MMVSTIRPEQIEQIIVATQAGSSRPEIAQLANVCEKTVWNYQHEFCKI